MDSELIRRALEVLSSAKTMGTMTTVSMQQLAMMPPDHLAERVNRDMARSFAHPIAEFLVKSEAVVKTEDYSRGLGDEYRAEVVIMSREDFSTISSLLRHLVQESGVGPADLGERLD